MSVKLIDGRGIVTFIKELKNIFATEADVTSFKAATDNYILDIDYSLLEFDTNSLVSEDASPSD